MARRIIGRGWGQSYQHSKALHSWFAHIPGLKVVMPATPRGNTNAPTIAVAERAADLMYRMYRFVRLKDVGDDRPFSSLRRWCCPPLAAPWWR